MTRHRAPRRMCYSIVISIFLMISIVSARQNDLISIRQEAQISTNLRRTRETKPLLHPRHQPGLFNLRRQSDVKTSKPQGSAGITVTLNEYKNLKLAMSGGRTCNCPPYHVCPYLTNIASPCFFSFSVAVSTSRGVSFMSTNFIPFNGTLADSRGDNEFDKEMVFSDLDAVPTSIDVLIYQLGPVIDSSGQAIYIDYLVLADEFNFQIETDRRANDFSRPDSRPLKRKANSSIIDSSIELTHTVTCKMNYYGSRCDMLCEEQKSDSATVKSFVCTSPQDAGNFSYLCTPEPTRMNNCKPCAYRDNSAFCEPFDKSDKPVPAALDVIDFYWVYVFVVLLIFLLIIIVLLLIHFVRERRRNLVYGDKVKFFSPANSGDLDAAGGAGSGTDSTKRSGRHFTIDHELPPNAVKRGLSPPRSPFYETSSSGGSTASEHVGSGNGGNGVPPPPMVVDRADYGGGYGNAPVERREALV